METKKCTHCGRILPISEFYKARKTKDGLQAYCKECSKESANKSHKKKNGSLGKVEVGDGIPEALKNALSIAKNDKEDLILPTKEKVVETPRVVVEKTPITVVKKDDDDTKATSRRTTLANALPIDLMKELANRGYYGVIHFREKKIETIEHNGYNGIFEYWDEHNIDITKFKDVEED